MNLSQTLHTAIVDRELIIIESYYDIILAKIDITYLLMQKLDLQTQRANTRFKR